MQPADIGRSIYCLPERSEQSRWDGPDNWSGSCSLNVLLIDVSRPGRSL